MSPFRRRQPVVDRAELFKELQNLEARVEKSKADLQRAKESGEGRYLRAAQARLDRHDAAYSELWGRLYPGPSIGSPFGRDPDEPPPLDVEKKTTCQYCSEFLTDDEWLAGCCPRHNKADYPNGIPSTDPRWTPFDLPGGSAQ